MPEGPATGLTSRQQAVKRAFDLVVAAIAAVPSLPLCLVAVVAATIDTRESGLFSQDRVGRGGRVFRIYKIRTMRTPGGGGSTVTRRGDPRITRFGAVLRALKIDELPQLLNVLRGDMSLVGPRPDVPGWADALTGEDRIVLLVRPGITGPASLAFRHEEAALASAADPELYNRQVIWPEKVRLNRGYVEHWTFRGDLRLIWATVAVIAERR